MLSLTRSAALDFAPHGVLVNGVAPGPDATEPVRARYPDLAERAEIIVITQDDPAFPADADWVIHDADLALSWHHDIETVPTLLRVEQAASGQAVDS